MANVTETHPNFVFKFLIFGQHVVMKEVDFIMFLDQSTAFKDDISTEVFRRSVRRR